MAGADIKLARRGVPVDEIPRRASRSGSNPQVLALSQTNGDLLWFENDGSQSFTEHAIDDTTLTQPNDVYATDMDGRVRCGGPLAF